MFYWWGYKVGITPYQWSSKPFWSWWLCLKAYVYTSFKEASAGLCKALTSASPLYLPHKDKRPCSFDAFCMIPLDKHPSVYPIGIGDVPRRIIAKLILLAIGEDIVFTTGPLNRLALAMLLVLKLLFMQWRRCLKTVNVKLLFLLMLQKNAFNSCVNRQAALHNISFPCPSFATTLHNTYGAESPVHLFVVGEGKISSTEGTTQGDPLTMAMCTLAVVPLIRHLSTNSCAWCFSADNTFAVGSLLNLLSWWQLLSSIGPNYGCFTNAAKTVL